MSVQQQQALDSLYAIDNVLTVKITMPQSDWDALRTEQPAGGVCNFDWTGDSRYTWRKATTVEISGTRFPDRTEFTQVGVKKKSFCGSINSDKPCLHIDFGKFSDANIPVVEGLIGARYLTLNNSIQDRSYIRQPLGYKLLATAGLPHSRCNFARVFVNGELIGEGVSGVNSPGIFVNAEPIMPRYIEREFNGNMNGNLYELECGDDFVSRRLQFIATESLSKFKNKADLEFADDYIAANGAAGANDMLDLDQFIKLYAMEFLLKHWDGYTSNTNNTYIYNDLDAVKKPGVNDVKFKMIPWGIDQTLQPQTPFKLGNRGLIARLVRNDAARRAQLIDQIRTYRESVFSPHTQETVLKPMIDQMERLLVKLGVPNAVTEIATVRQQLRLVESAGRLRTGLPGATVIALVPRDNHIDLFATGTHGAVWTTWWEPGPSWQNWFPIHPETKMQPGATVSALVPRDNHIDLFATGADGTVWSTWWEPGPSWQNWFPIHPETKMQPGATVSALVPRDNHIDLFATGADGTVWSTWWEPGPSWQNWFPIHPETKMQPGARISALVPRDNHIDLFTTGTDGTVRSTWWQPDTGWQNWFPIHPETKMQPGARISALVPRDNHIDLFTTGTDGTVRSTWWQPDTGWQDWFPIHPETKMHPGATVSALVPRDNHIDLFTTGTDGTVRSTWWQPDTGWQDWFPIHPETKMHPGATVSALVPRDNHIDLFATGTDGAVWTTWWEAGPSWQDWSVLP